MEKNTRSRIEKDRIKVLIKCEGRLKQEFGNGEDFTSQIF